MEKQNLDEKPIVIAMKGHPGTGKSTLAKAIAKKLKCPLIDKDHFKNCTKEIQETLISSAPKSSSSSYNKLLNDLSYKVMWQIASTQLDLGLNVLIDSPLSRRAHLDKLLEIADRTKARVFVVECRPKDEAEWRRRVEKRGVDDDDDGGSSWHKPRNWEEMEKLLDGYGGCWDYDFGDDVPKLVVDTTANDIGIHEIVSSVLQFLESPCHG